MQESNRKQDRDHRKFEILPPKPISCLFRQQYHYGTWQRKEACFPKKSHISNLQRLVFSSSRAGISCQFYTTVTTTRIVEIATEDGTDNDTVNSKLDPLDLESVVYTKYGIHLQVDGWPFERARTGVEDRLYSIEYGIAWEQDSLSRGFLEYGISWVRDFLRSVSIGIETLGRILFSMYDLEWWSWAAFHAGSEGESSSFNFIYLKPNSFHNWLNIIHNLKNCQHLPSSCSTT